MNDFNAPELLKQLLSQSPCPAVEEVSRLVCAALQNSATELNKKDQATQVLLDVIHKPDLFVALAKHIPTPWIDFLGGTSSLWSKIIDQTVNEVLFEGASFSSPLFALVRRWTHPNSIHAVKPNQHPTAQLYWLTLQTIALHTKGGEFVECVRTTKGPVRQWMEYFHKSVNHTDTVEGAPIFEKLMLDLPPTPASDALWVWRLDKNYSRCIQLPYEQMHRSPLSPSSIAYAVFKNSPGAIPQQVRDCVFSWGRSLDVIEEIKNRYALHVSADFVNRLIDENLNFPLSQKVWDSFGEDPMKFMHALNMDAHHNGLMAKYSTGEVRRSGNGKHGEKILEFASKIWQDAGKMQETEEDPWNKLTLLLHKTGLLPHVIFKSWNCSIASENKRWSKIEEGLKNEDDSAWVWKIFRAPQQHPSVNISEDLKRLALLEMVISVDQPLHYQQVIDNTPNLCPSELTVRQRYAVAKTLCDRITWDEQPIQQIAWLEDFFKQMNNMSQTVDTRTLILQSFMSHYKIPSGQEMADLLTQNSTQGHLLQNVLRHTTDANFPYDQSLERPLSQVIEKFLLLEATNYSSVTVAPSKRKI